MSKKQIHKIFELFYRDKFCSYEIAHEMNLPEAAVSNAMGDEKNVSIKREYIDKFGGIRMNHKDMRSEMSSLLKDIRAKYQKQEIEYMTGRRWDQMDRFANWKGAVTDASIPKLQEAIIIMKDDLRRGD